MQAIFLYTKKVQFLETYSCNSQFNDLILILKSSIRVFLNLPSERQTFLEINVLLGTLEKLKMETQSFKKTIARVELFSEIDK